MWRETRTGDMTPLCGRVAGAVLATIRRQLGYTQEQLAERLEVSPVTLQTWERGAKPLVNLPHVRLHQLRRRLVILGAPEDLLRIWDTALQVDNVLAQIDSPDPDDHPLAFTVPTRAMTELLAWPLFGAVPRGLAGTPARLDVARGERQSVLSALRAVAERAVGRTERHAMLRRQVRFLLARDPASRDWVAHQQPTDVRPRDLGEWTPAWPLARSAAVTAATAGDLDLIRAFIATGLSTDTGIAANLRYWAYWVGEIPELWDADAAMTRAGTSGWSGELLLGSLLDGVLNAPYRDLSAQTLWALLRVRKRLASDPAWTRPIQQAVQRALDSGHLDDSSARKLDAVNYTLEVA
jgi:transcriptional regulator with XRE-family HTH domain